MSWQNSPYEEAVSGPYEQQQKQAIAEKLTSHKINSSWRIVKHPEGAKCLDAIWLFKIKQDSNNAVKEFKAILCILGCKQEEEVDYQYTYSPVVKYDALRILFAIAAQYDLELVQVDIKTAYLYGDLEETIYVKIPK